MGRKGFTLMEVLAAITILSLVLGIAGRSVIGIINTSKERSEVLFVEEIDKAIDEYISLEGSKLVKDNTSAYSFEKCRNAYCTETKVVQAHELFNRDGSNINLSVILDSFEEEKLTNPVNKLDCLNGVNPVIRIFKDSDYVYYYYINVGGSNTSCEIKAENGIINTLPDNLLIDIDCSNLDEYLKGYKNLVLDKMIQKLTDQKSLASNQSEKNEIQQKIDNLKLKICSS